jgi:hypothetical protein
MSEIAKALLAIQREMPPVKPDAENPHFKSKFVSLDHLLAVILPVLNRHAVTLVQMPSSLDGAPALTTWLLHESGDSIDSTMPLVLPKNDPQGQGSALTYARRYALAAALGISAEKDDDGERATEAVAKQKPQEKASGSFAAWEAEMASLGVENAAGWAKAATEASGGKDSSTMAKLGQALAALRAKDEGLFPHVGSDPELVTAAFAEAFQVLVEAP